MKKKIFITLFLIITLFTINTSSSNYNNTIAPLVKEIKDSVVAIKNINDTKINDSFSGSGFIIDKDGLVVTNYHVIKNAKKIEIILNSNIYDAILIGYDDKLDIALLKIKSDTEFNFVEFADSSNIEIGDFIVAIGNPYGLGGTVTTGIISAINRNINMTPYDDFIQIDAAINKGNSGGPTFNMEGKVIGVNTAIISPTGGNVGLAFSIPSNKVKKIVNDIKVFGFVKRSWIGVNLQPLTNEMLEALNIDLKGSVIVTKISPKSPALKYQLKIGDIIYAINDRNINGIKDLIKKIQKTEVNDFIKLKVLRNNKKIEINLQTAQWPKIA
tara:strand:- start:4559 stop:5542 length:984 start_codon:yes stop_codon:yes gene_type:complete